MQRIQRIRGVSWAQECSEKEFLLCLELVHKSMQVLQSLLTLLEMDNKRDLDLAIILSNNSY